MIYLDNASTTPVSRGVLNDMLPYFTEKFGNAGTLYSLGRDAKAAIEKAREQTAKLFGCNPGFVFFNSGASEGNATVFEGIWGTLRSFGQTHIVVSETEHESAYLAAGQLGLKGFELSTVKPNADGVVTCDAVKAVLRDNTGLVSVMYCNNETGAVNEVKAIGELCAEREIFFHCDCTQAAGQYPLDVNENNISFATISAHKMYGPKGVGALYMITSLDPIIQGSSQQEDGFRGGTENVPGIVGLGSACASAVFNMERDNEYIQNLKQQFVWELCHHMDVTSLEDAGMGINGRHWVSTGKVLNLHISGVHGESLVLAMDAMGVCISSVSACSEHSDEPSRTLVSMGLTAEQARECVRVSFSNFNTVAEVKEAARLMAVAVKLLREGVSIP